MQSGYFPGICHLESDFPDEENLAHPYSVDNVFGPWLAIRNNNTVYKKSPYICVTCHMEQCSVISIIVLILEAIQ